VPAALVAVAVPDAVSADEIPFLNGVTSSGSAGRSEEHDEDHHGAAADCGPGPRPAYAGIALDGAVIKTRGDTYGMPKAR
jgi:hypothetical protein